jgi:hypothetical protein
MARRGRYPGPGYDETGPGTPKKKASTKYSPAPMSAAAKAKAAARGRLTAMATKAGAFSKSITPPAKKGVGKAFTSAEVAKLRKMLKNK